MTELCAEQAESTPAEGLAEGAWPHPGCCKATAHEARSAVMLGPSATPITDMGEAMLSGENPAEFVVPAIRTAELATVHKCLTAEASKREPT
jgi:hypothetical protein